MAAYPSYGILLDSKRTAESKWRDEFSDAGSQHSRQLRSLEYVTFELVHQLTVTQYRALMTTFNAGERDTYTLTYFDESPAVTYSVKFLRPPNITQNFGNGKLEVEVVLRGTPD